MKVKIRLALCSVLVLAMLLWATPALAVPPLPQAFYGTVLINGSNALVGTVVSAKINGVNAGSYTTTVAGQYGNVATHDYLAVSCDGANDGDIITFYVQGVSTGLTATFEVGGGPTEKNLSVTISGGGGGGGGTITTTVTTNFFGTQSSFKVDSSGIVQETFTATSADGELTITIPAGTKCLDKDGNPLTSLTCTPVSPPAPPENANIIGLAYDFTDAVTFVPPAILEFTVSPDDIILPLTVDDLVGAYYDETSTPPGWVDLPTSVVPGTTYVLQVFVPHTTTFAIIGTLKPASFTLSSLVISPIQVAPGEKVNISVSVDNTGGMDGSYTVVLKINDVKEAEKSVTVAAGSSQTVSFSVTKAEAGKYDVVVDGLSGSFTVTAPTTTPTPTTPTPTTPTPTMPTPTTPTPTPTPTNWPLICGIIAGVIAVVGLAIFFVRRRRSY